MGLASETSERSIVGGNQGFVQGKRAGKRVCRKALSSSGRRDCARTQFGVIKEMAKKGKHERANRTQDCTRVDRKVEVRDPEVHSPGETEQVVVYGSVVRRLQLGCSRLLGKGVRRVDVFFCQLDPILQRPSTFNNWIDSTELVGLHLFRTDIPLLANFTWS